MSTAPTASTAGTVPGASSALPTGSVHLPPPGSVAADECQGDLYSPPILESDFADSYDMSKPLVAETVRFVVHDVNELRREGYCILAVAITPNPVVILPLSRYNEATVRAIRARYAYPDQLQIKTP